MPQRNFFYTLWRVKTDIFPKKNIFPDIKCPYLLVLPVRCNLNCQTAYRYGSSRAIPVNHQFRYHTACIIDRDFDSTTKSILHVNIAFKKCKKYNTTNNIFSLGESSNSEKLACYKNRIKMVQLNCSEMSKWSGNSGIRTGINQAIILYFSQESKI